MPRFNQEPLEREPNAVAFDVTTSYKPFGGKLLCRECYSVWLDNRDGDESLSGEPFNVEHLDAGETCEQCGVEVGPHRAPHLMTASDWDDVRADLDYHERN